MKRVLSLTVLGAAFVTPAFGAIDSYMTFNGMGWDGPSKIRVQSVRNEVVTPEEMRGGLRAGHRKWAPFVITRRMDAASPKLMTWCATGEHRPRTGKLVITAVEMGADGRPKPVYTITLTNPMVSSFRRGSGEQPTESISFTFQKIEWTYAQGNKTASDAWDAK